jgi:hypothetical protein
MRSLSALAQKKTTTKTIINALVRRTLSTVHMMFAPSFTSFTSFTSLYLSLSLSLSLCAFVCVRKVMKRLESFATRRIREKNASEVSAQMLTTITIVRANAFNENNNERRRTSKPKPKPLRQGDVTKKRCDQCLGAGKVPCYNCTRGGVAKCDKVGYVPKNTFTFRLPFGWTQERRENETTTKKKKKGGEKKEAEVNIERCSVCSANGKLACGRCNGQGVLLYRSADWR